MWNAGLYLAGGFLVGLAVSFLVPPAETSFALGTSSASPLSESKHVVDRTNKTDRLPLPKTLIHYDVRPSRPAPATQLEPVLLGCDPAFNPKFLAMQFDYPRICLSENTTMASIVG
jgi:hypothetical protein